MIRMLFLDDDDQRHKSFLKKFPYATTVTTAEACIEALKRHPWDVVWLDHDLGGEVYRNPKDKNCGMEVVRWLTEYITSVGQIVVHTLNHPAGIRMVDTLVDHGYNVFRLTFLELDKAKLEIVRRF